MNRQEFFKTCACGLCTCAAAGLLGPAALAADEKPTAEDWRFPFIQDRYAKLLEILAVRTGEESLNETLRHLGRFCASKLPLVEKHKGNIDAFIREFKARAGEEITFDREKGIITVVGPERSDCFCPLASRRCTPPSICACSLGWQQYVYENLLGQPVDVTLKEAVLRGGKRCAFEIRLKTNPPG